MAENHNQDDDYEKNNNYEKMRSELDYYAANRGNAAMGSRNDETGLRKTRTRIIGSLVGLGMLASGALVGLDKCEGNLYLSSDQEETKTEMSSEPVAKDESPTPENTARDEAEPQESSHPETGYSVFSENMDDLEEKVEDLDSRISSLYDRQQDYLEDGRESLTGIREHIDGLEEQLSELRSQIPGERPDAQRYDVGMIYGSSVPERTKARYNLDSFSEGMTLNDMVETVSTWEDFHVGQMRYIELPDGKMLVLFGNAQADENNTLNAYFSRYNEDGDKTNIYSSVQFGGIRDHVPRGNFEITLPFGEDARDYLGQKLEDYEPYLVLSKRGSDIDLALVLGDRPDVNFRGDTIYLGNR